MFPSDSHPPSPAAVTCDVAAAVVTAVPATEAARLREPLQAAFPDRLSNAMLKQADEQSLLALAAFRDTFDRHPGLRSTTTGWGLVAAPRVPGRRRMVESLQKFREQGAWSVSPHIIPHCTLHSLSGLLSQVLGLHGPNIGAGGKPGGESEALTVAAAWLAADRLPGVWVVLTGWDVESPTNAGATCQAAVLALTAAEVTSPLLGDGRKAIQIAGDGEGTYSSFPLREGGRGGRFPRLTIQPAGSHAPALPPFTLEGLRSALDNPAAFFSWGLGRGGSLSLQPARRIWEAAA